MCKDSFTMDVRIHHQQINQCILLTIPFQLDIINTNISKLQKSLPNILLCIQVQYQVEKKQLLGTGSKLSLLSFSLAGQVVLD